MSHWSSKYLNIPYLADGRGWDGADCWGLVRLVLKEEKGLDLPSYGEISSEELLQIHKKIKEQVELAEVWENIPRESIQPFDICAMTAVGKRIVCHVGIMVDNKHLLHVEKVADSVIIPLTDRTIRERISCFRRYKMNK